VPPALAPRPGGTRRGRMREALAMGDAERTAFLEAHETRPL
jgi:hypothetical protein